MSRKTKFLNRFFNTTEFGDLEPPDYKSNTIHNWTEAPCGSNYGKSEFGSRDFFEEIEVYRYSSHPWIRQAIASFDIEGKCVLEIGIGVGTDHLNLARRGARMCGVDLAPRNLEITSKRFRVYGFQSGLIIGDAENLPYADNSVDFVYAFGVIHHCLDTKKTISEIYRVLRPGGRCFVTVYHKNSVFFWWTVFFVEFFLKGGWRKRSIQQQISLVEYPNNNEGLVVKLFGRRQVETMFQEFHETRSYIRHLLPNDVAFLSMLYGNPHKPTPFLTKIGNKFGWYVVIEGVK